MKRCMFTGHRPTKLPFGFDEENARCVELKMRIEIAIRKAILTGHSEFLCGMAQGVDTFAAEAVLRLREREFPAIRLIAVIPCPEQEKSWTDAAKVRYRKILNAADERVTISPFYTKSCMLMRNRYLVDHADICLAVWDGTSGGTATTVLLAKQKSIPVIIIEP